MATIKRAAAAVGVPEATLRAWERRYAVVAPGRSPAGYRIYDDRELRVLSDMAALVRAGWAPREAAERVKSQKPAHADIPSAPDSGLPARANESVAAVDDLARVARDLDREALEATLDSAFALGSFDKTVDAWLMPALRQLGLAWRDGRVDPAGEHFVSSTVQRRLGAAMDAAGRPVAGPRVAVGLAEGSRHELGVLAFAVVLQRAGVDVSYLGADLPAQSWVGAVNRIRADAVVLGVPMSQDVLAVRGTVTALEASFPGLPIFLGGAAQDEVGASARPLGHSIMHTARDLAGLLRASAADG